ncbi:MAG: phosphoribosylformylglycinamidine cyclo-ligase [Eubacteriales bacterium]|nr:phosphoribosylformylglycinamidine cyclo-ligase [Eubacteriales bacterium]
MKEHNKSFSQSYKDAGVDITAGYKSVELIKKHIAKTQVNNSLNEIGGFGGLFPLELGNMKKPILVSGTDGVGTKLKLAFLLDKHDTIGIDCVAMCVNDIICSGAKPLFFLDYIAISKNYPEKIEQIVKGVSDACVLSGCQLVGGETAEMPGFYQKDEYDLAGFCVGVVDEEKMINNKNVKEGDVIIGIASSGVHSNGFSLVRKIFNVENANLNEKFEELNGKTIGEALLTPTKVYVKPILELMKHININSISHITGGGFYENIPRSLPEGLTAKIEKSSIKILPIFELISKKGNVPEKDMFNTFNMGIGMTVIVDKEDSKKAVEILKDLGEDAYIIGNVISSDEGVIIC